MNGPIMYSSELYEERHPFFDIVRDVCREMNVIEGYVLRRNSKHDAVKIRAIIAKRAWVAGFTQKEIGEFLAINPSTINHYINKC